MKGKEKMEKTNNKKPTHKIKALYNKIIQVKLTKIMWMALLTYFTRHV